MIELNNSGNAEMSLANAFVYIYFIANVGLLAVFRTCTNLTYPSLHAIAHSLGLLCLSRLRSAAPRHSLCPDLILDLSNVSWRPKFCKLDVPVQERFEGLACSEF